MYTWFSDDVSLHDKPNDEKTSGRTRTVLSQIGTFPVMNFTFGQLIAFLVIKWFYKSFLFNKPGRRGILLFLVILLFIQMLKYLINHKTLLNHFAIILVTSFLLKYDNLYDRMLYKIIYNNICLIMNDFVLVSSE